VPVEGFESAYEVSDQGRVRSLLTGRTLRPSKRGRYHGVTLRRDGASHSVYIHHLVAAAFLGARPAGMDICHGPGGRFDNRAVNLRYDTHHANMRDSLLQGTHRSLTLTHCTRGHALTAENTYTLRSAAGDGGVKIRRRCRTCLKMKSARDYQVWKRRHRGVGIA